jgi:tRNA dimethylallyltransferase
VNPAERQTEVFAILGPTAVGKTDLAVQVAQALQSEILSCDSRQVYRFMDIGTAKPGESQLAEIRHYMIDIVEPSQPFSAWDFAEKAGSIIEDRVNAGARILICGGTGLYYKSLTEGLSLRVPSNTDFRQRCERRASENGPDSLHRELSSVDPVSACRLHPNDLFRIIRALQVYHDTGVPFSQHIKASPKPTGIRGKAILLNLPRRQLYERINRRVEQMVEKGLFEEFRGLRAMGYGPDSPGMECVGYKELFDVDDGRMSMKEAIGIIQQNTRHFAKRQITWFSNKCSGLRVDMTSPEAFRDICRYISKPAKAGID